MLDPLRPLDVLNCLTGYRAGAGGEAELPEFAVVVDGFGVVVGGVQIISTPTAAPANTALPVINETPVVGQTLTGTNGEWDNNPTSFLYQWLMDDVEVSGATSNEYLVDAADEGAVPTFAVTAVNAAGSTEAVSLGADPVSPPLDPPAAPVLALDSPLTNPPTFSIEMDLPEVGDVLRLQIATDAGFSSLVVNTTKTLDMGEAADEEATFTIGTLDPDDYFARVNHTRSGTSDWSNTVTFTIA
jgi:hypothetical protein